MKGGNKMVKLYLDVGHGGSDPGAIGNGLKEKDLTLQIGKKINDLLKDYEGITVKMSRSTDKTLSLKQRTDEANKWGADLLLSIHINAGGGTGFESFIYNGTVNNTTVKYRDIIHDEIMKVLKGVKDRGKKRANFHMLRESKMPAIITENMFIDTKKDADKLKEQSFINKIAQGHVNGIVKLFNLKKKKTDTKPSNNKDETFYRVVAGSFKNRKNAEDQVKKLKKLGIDVFIDVYKK